MFCRLTDGVYLKSKRLTADGVALEHDVDQSFEGAERSPVDRLNAIIGQHQIPQ